MKLAQVPIVPQWHLYNGSICTPDGGFLYIGARTINYIGCVGDNLNPIVKVFHTQQTIVSIDIDPVWKEFDGKKNKFFVVLAQDNSIQIWDFDKSYAVKGHKAHLGTLRFMDGNDPAHSQGGRVLLGYMCNSNVLSIDAQDIIMYCVTSNTYSRKPMFVSSRNQKFTALRCSPYSEFIFALGTSRGLVLVCDQKKMHTLHTFRGHDSQITSLDWSRMRNNMNSIHSQLPKVVQTSNKIASPLEEDIFDIYDYDYLENEFGAPCNVKGQKSCIENEFKRIEKPQKSPGCAEFDFVEACQSLKDEMDALKTEPKLPEDAVTLADCHLVEKNYDTLSLDEKESSEGSVDLKESSFSSDDVVDGIEPKNNQQFLHHVEVHAIQTHKHVESRETFENTYFSEGDVLLASASVDCDLWIWNTSTGASCGNLKISCARKLSRNTNIQITWINTINLLANNKNGELMYWRLIPHQLLNSDVNKANIYKFKEEKLQFATHGVVSFNICLKKDLLWSISSYREISCHTLGTNQLIAKYSCASTNISVMRECPDDMNKIALGFSDRRIGMMDISKISITNVSIVNYTQRIESSVLSIAWSPDNKRLAYGTIEGRVGIINVEDPKKPTFVYNPVFGKPIYSIDWKHRHIYVVCNEKLAIYKDSENKKDGFILGGINSNISAVSVRGNYIFIGTQRGKLQVYRCKYDDLLNCELLQDLPLASRYITEISWCPLINEKFVVVANGNNIHVFNFDHEQGVIVETNRITLKNPKAANATVKWSNRNENQFLTCGFDGAVRVWDLSSDGTYHEKFLKQYHCPMLAGLFLPTDENIVLCAGKSTSLEFIDMRTEQTNEFVRTTEGCLKQTQDVQWAQKALVLTDIKPTASVKRRYKRTSDDSAVINSDSDKLTTEIIEEVANLKLEDTANHFATSKTGKLGEDPSGRCSLISIKNPTTLLYLTTKEINTEALVKLSLIVSSVNRENMYLDHIMCARLFGTKSQAKLLLAEELKNSQQSGAKVISSALMMQIDGDIKHEILKCIQNKNLCEWHVSLAPSISYNFWQKCCQAFAEQLLEQDCCLQAAIYMMVIHRQAEAIKMLIHRYYFKEALLTARIYLQPEDPLINVIIDNWISYLDFTGNLSGAALLCTLSGRKGRAIEILRKIRNPQQEVESVLKLLNNDHN